MQLTVKPATFFRRNNQTVLLNPDFMYDVSIPNYNVIFSTPQIQTDWFSIQKRIGRNEHIHVFLFEIDEEANAIEGLYDFIQMMNQKVDKPVYIHITKRYAWNASSILEKLEHATWNCQKLRFRIIAEKNSNTTLFTDYYRYIYYDTKTLSNGSMKNHDRRIAENFILVSWIGFPKNYANISYYDPKTNKFSEKEIMSI